MFHDCWNKAAAYQIISAKFILFLFSVYYWEIVNTLIYIIKYNKNMALTMEQKKIFCAKINYGTESLKSVSARYRKNFNFNTFRNRNHIFKLVKNFELHGTYEDYSETGSSPFGSTIIQGKNASIINIFSTVSLTEWQTSEACTLRFFLTFLFHESG